MWNRDKVAECVVTFQEIAEIHRQLATTHLSAAQILLEGAIQFAEEKRPSVPLMRQAQVFQERQIRLRNQLADLMIKAEKQVLGCND